MNKARESVVRLDSVEDGAWYTFEDDVLAMLPGQSDRELVVRLDSVEDGARYTFEDGVLAMLPGQSDRYSCVDRLAPGHKRLWRCKQLLNMEAYRLYAGSIMNIDHSLGILNDILNVFSNIPKNSSGSITEWHRALTKGESALPKRVTIWAQSNISSEDAGVGTILELESHISGRGGGASARSTELQPRPNRFGEWHKASTKAQCAPPNIVESPAWLKSLGRASLGSKLSVELWQVAELPPRLISSLTQKSQPKMLEWVQFWNLTQTFSATVVALRREPQSFDQG
ncbi:hypothetical protein C8J57DRAFT_1223844 [Mycena rebaudengoi]|nr:hypothetical protein C8J57DRAFT_1223844 [Mycena rebaudengoi]